MLARAGFGPDTMMARDALEIATLGGAKVPNRDAIGALDRDYGLVGEGSDQLDLLAGEWPRLGTCEAKYSGLQLPNPATMTMIRLFHVSGSGRRPCKGSTS